MRSLFTALLAVLALALSSCASVQRADYRVSEAGIDILADMQGAGKIQLGVIVGKDGIFVCASGAKTKPICVQARAVSAK